jgi:hypothetical protein
MDILKGGCVYCELVDINSGETEELYKYVECFLAKVKSVGYKSFKRWREKLEFRDDFIYCFNCRLL